MSTTPPIPPTPPVQASSPPRQPRHRRRWPCLWVLGCAGVFLLCVLASVVTIPLIAGMVGRTSPASVSQGNTHNTAETATHFLDSLMRQAYEQAYGDLDSSLLIGLSQSDFVQAARLADRCDGPITSYKEVSNVNGRLTYQVSRKKRSHPYQLTLVLQPDATGTWHITTYGNGNIQDLDLAPGQSACNH